MCGLCSVLGALAGSELVKIHSQKITHRFAYGVESRDCSFSSLISKAMPGQRQCSARPLGQMLDPRSSDVGAWLHPGWLGGT